MKLRNKLIPLMSVAAVATTVAPIAASCGTVTVTTMEMIDVLHGYTPTVARAEASTELTAEQAQDLFVEHVKANPEIFVQDMSWWEARAMKSRLNNAAWGDYFKDNVDPTHPTNALGMTESGKDYGFLGDVYTQYGLIPATYDGSEPESIKDSFVMIPQVAQFGVSDIKLEKVTLVNPNTNKPEIFNTISLKFNYNFEFEIVGDFIELDGYNHYSIKRNVTSALTSEYQNIPFVCRWDSKYATWMVEPTGWATPGNTASNLAWILQKNENWFLNFDLKASTVDTVTDYNGNVDTYTYDDSKAANISSYAQLRSWLTSQKVNKHYLEKLTRQIMFNFGSYHLYDILGPKWAQTNFGNLDDASVSQSTTSVMKVTMKSSFNRNWSYAEAITGDCPQSTGKSYLDSEEGLSFPLYWRENNKSTEWTLAGQAKFLKADNKDIMSDFAGVSAQVNLVVSFELDEGKEFPAIGLDLDCFKFTVPANTNFNFKLYYGTDENGKDIFKSEKVTINNDVECFWLAMNSK